MKLLLKNAHLIDPSQQLDGIFDVLIDKEKIVEIKTSIQSPDAEAHDLRDMILAPGFIDMHVHLREPGQEESETIQTGTRAAAAGGFTAVACMPNTQPVNDNSEVTSYILQKATEHADVAVYPIGAVTEKQAGKELNDLSALKTAGAIAVSDDGKPVANSQMMREAVQLADSVGLLVIDHCEDPYLFQDGVMHEGDYSKKLGARGIPSACEEIMVARNILIAKLTKGRIHLAHMSTAGSMEMIRRAKAEGCRVSAEVTPHHFTLTDGLVSLENTNTKMNPPLRSQSDVDAVLAALADGTVDVIASDHAPHHISLKKVPYNRAAFGIIGLETSVSLGLDRLLNTNWISMNRFIELYSLNAAKLLGIERGIRVGAEANLTAFHPTKTITVDVSKFRSKSRNTPFNGWKLRGCPTATIVRGKIVWSNL
jgi:dihydroorotase